MIRTCRNCNTPIKTTGRGRRTYCDELCKRQFHAARASDRPPRETDPDDIGPELRRYLAAFDRKLRGPDGIDIAMELARSIGIPIPGED